MSLKSIWDDNPLTIITPIVGVVMVVLNMWFIVRIQPLESRVARMEDNLVDMQDTLQDIQSNGTFQERLNTQRINETSEDTKEIKDSILRLEDQLDK